MILLLVAHDIDHLVDGIVLKAQFGSTDILRHIDAGAILTEQQFLIQSIAGQVCPYRVIGAAVEDALLQASLYFFLAL